MAALDDKKIQLVNQINDLVFKPVSWLAKINFINHLTLLNNVLVAVLADKNGGKSSFINLLCTSLDSNIQYVLQSAEPSFTSTNLSKELGEKFSLRPDYLIKVSDIVTQINQRKCHVLVIIDNAHHLPEAFIHELLAAIKDYEKQNYFHVCLVGDYSLLTSLNKLAQSLYPNLIHTLEPGNLTESETKTYVLKKSDDKNLSDNTLHLFYQQTGGNIAKINAKLLNIDKVAKQKTDWLNKKAKYFANKMLVSGKKAAGLIVIILGVNYFWPKLSTSNVAMNPTDYHAPVSVAQQKRIANFKVAPKPVVQEPILISTIAPINNQYLTIQLYSSTNQHDLKKFISAHQDAAIAQIKHKLYKGKDWYVLIWGNYQQPHEAKDALKKLPQSLAKFKPMIINGNELLELG